MIPPLGSFHLGSFDIQLPTARGNYRLDVMNAGELDEYYGAAIFLNDGPTWPDAWRASSGELIGGVTIFMVSGPIPAISGPALYILAIAFVAFGTWLLRLRRRAIA